MVSERYRAIVLVGLAFVVCAAVYLYQGKRYYDHFLKMDIAQAGDRIQESVEAVEELSFIPFGEKMSQMLARSPDVVAAFAGQRREELYQRIFPDYQALRLQNSFLAGLNLYRPDGTVLLRMEQPAFYGNRPHSVRKILAAVLETGQQQTGYVVGPHGLAYHILQPVYQGSDHLVGFLEYEIDARRFVEFIGRRVRQPVAVFYRSDLVDVEGRRPPDGMVAVEMGGFTLWRGDHSPFDQLPPSLMLGHGDQEVTVNKRPYMLHVQFLFRDHKNIPVGGVAALQDLSSHYRQRQGFFRNSVILLFSLAGCALLFLYFRIGRMSSSLAEESDGRRKAEAAVDLAEKEWERTVNAVPDFISILDLNYRVVRTNRRLPEALGLSMEEVVGRHCHELFCGSRGNNDSGLCCPYGEIKTGARFWSREMYYPALGGYFDVSLSPLYDDEDRFVGAVHVARNIDERRRIEQQARENLLYLRSVLEASRNSAIVATDDALQVRYCNQQVERLLGLSVKDLVGQPVHRLLDECDADLRALFEGLFQAGNAGDAYCQHLFRKGKYVLEAQFSLISARDGKSTGVLLMFRDVTAQKEAEERMMRAEKLEAIGLLAGGVAHDLNNILAGIINYPELLKHRLAGDAAAVRLVERLQKAGRRAADVVADLLTMARGVAMEKDILQLNELVHDYLTSPECVDLCARYPRHELRLDLDESSWPCRCSATHITKILMNLVGNAMEAMSESGTVTIRVRNYSPTATSQEHTIREGNFVMLEVADTGTGIPQEHLPHIFEPFYSTKKLGRSGSGLGLSIVWNTVEEHGGFVNVESGSSGTVFSICLPAVTEPVENRQRGYGGETLQELKGKGTVLVVDDDAEQRIMASQMLTLLGYEVHTVSSGEYALDFVRKNPVDVLLLDMMMSPGMNGRQTYERILEMYPEQKALIASGLAEDSEIQLALELGVYGFIGKPYTLEELGRLLQGVLCQ
ncbi:ATP-binding protein [Desulfolithobacter sp.]